MEAIATKQETADELKERLESGDHGNLTEELKALLASNISDMDKIYLSDIITGEMKLNAEKKQEVKEILSPLIAELHEDPTPLHNAVRKCTIRRIDVIDFALLFGFEFDKHPDILKTAFTDGHPIFTEDTVSILCNRNFDFRNHPDIVKIAIRNDDFKLGDFAEYLQKQDFPFSEHPNIVKDFCHLYYRNDFDIGELIRNGESLNSNSGLCKFAEYLKDHQFPFKDNPNVVNVFCSLGRTFPRTIAYYMAYGENGFDFEGENTHPLSFIQENTKGNPELLEDILATTRRAKKADRPRQNFDIKGKLLPFSQP